MKNSPAQRARRADLAARNATPRQRRERARRKAMGVALIESPLKFIARTVGKHNSRTVEARSAAAVGAGQFVRAVARQLLNHGQ